MPEVHVCYFCAEQGHNSILAADVMLLEIATDISTAAVVAGWHPGQLQLLH
jgi:hypothetical protein